MPRRPVGEVVTTAFVTGITGQDGYYLAQQLVHEGVEVHGLVASDPDPARHGLPSDVTLHHGDVRDAAGLRALLLEIGPDEIYNLAAVSSVARSWEQPDLVAAVNGSAAVALLESAWQLQESSGRRVAVVQASSAEIFGAPHVSPQTEACPIAPVNPYGAAKAFAHLAVGVWRGRGLSASSAVLYNHESPRRPSAFVTRKITSTVAAIACGRADELVLGNLEARRDWGWAPDYVEAMVRMARSPRPADYVVATGHAHSVREFVAAAFVSAGLPDWEPLVRTDARFVRPTDPVEQVGDASRAQSELGWAPTISFAELVTKMVEADLCAGR